MRPTKLLVVAVFFIVFGGHAWLLSNFGSSIPIADQWDAEAANLYLPLSSDSLSWNQLIAPHNEHRILFTRLIDLGLLKLNGEWDSRLQTLLNAGLHASLAALLVLWTSAHLKRNAQLVFAFAIAILFTAPLGHENLLGGFQSQMFLLLLISLYSIHGLVANRPFSAKSICALFAGILVLFTMGSGFFAALSVIPLLIWNGACQRDARKTLWGLSAILCLIVGAGLMMKVTVAHHAELRAHGVLEFLKAFIKGAAWPLCAAQWPVVFLVAPWIWFVVRFLGKRTASTVMEGWILCLGIWSMLQLLAIAYARGGAGGISPRYAHILSIWMLANLTALFWLWTSSSDRRSSSFRVMTALWLVVAVLGISISVRKEFRQFLPESRDHFRAYERSVAAYVQTGNPRELDGEIPYPDKARLNALLDKPAIRKILPTGRPFLSNLARQTTEAGTWLFGAGLLLFLAVSVFQLRKTATKDGEG